MICTSCSHRHIASVHAHQVVHIHQPIPHDIVSVVHSHHHFVTNSTLMCTQEQLFYKPDRCPKPECGHPLELVKHQGSRFLKCKSYKCRKLTREAVSVYFENSGAPHSLFVTHRSACQCMNHTSTTTRMSLFVSPHNHTTLSFYLSLLYTTTEHCRSSQVQCAPWCTCHTCIRPRPQGSEPARITGSSSSSPCASPGGPLTYDRRPLCAISLPCIGFHRLTVFLVCCHAYSCASPCI